MMQHMPIIKQTEHFVERRAAERHEVAIRAEIDQCDWQPYRLAISEISLQGCRVSGLKCVTIGQQIDIAISDLGIMSARVVRRSGFKQHAIAFSTPLPEGSLDGLLTAEKKWAFVGSFPDAKHVTDAPAGVMKALSRIVSYGFRPNAA